MERKRKAAIEYRNVRPEPVIMQGGFHPALIPLAMAGATPVITSGAKWLGKKIFGEGIKRAGAGILRAGDRASRQPQAPIQGSGLAARLYEYASKATKTPRGYQPGEIPISRYQEKPHFMNGYQISGGMLQNLPGVPEPIKKLANKVALLGGKKKKGGKKKVAAKSKKKSSKK